MSASDERVTIDLIVFATGPLGPTSVVQKTVADAAAFASRLIVAGHRDVRLGSSLEDSVPYAIWLVAQRPSSLGVGIKPGAREGQR